MSLYLPNGQNGTDELVRKLFIGQSLDKFENYFQNTVWISSKIICRTQIEWEPDESIEVVQILPSEFISTAT